jgi:hypothetical protein
VLNVLAALAPLRDDRVLFLIVVGCLIGIGATAWVERKL